MTNKTNQNLSKIIASVNHLATAYDCKPDGYFSINAFAGAILEFVLENDMEDKFDDFTRRKCNRIADLAAELEAEAKGRAV